MPPARKPTAEEHAAAVRLAARQECDYLSFADFAEDLWHVAEPAAKLIWARHMTVVCDEIQAVLAEADRRRRVYEEIERAEKDPARRAARVEAELGSLPKLRLVILIPPRHSKSTIVSRLLPAWRWLHRPQEQILTLTAADTLIERDGLAVRDILKHDEYKAIQRRLVDTGRLKDGNPKNNPKLGCEKGEAFGLRPDQFAKEKFNNTAGGGRAGHVLGAGYTGVNADIIVIDDPHDIDDGFSGSPASQARLMEEVRATYKDKVQDRLNSQIWGVILLIMQRVHPKDLADYMIEQGAKVVCLPSEYDPEHPLRYRPGMGYVPTGTDWRTEPGEPLNPLRFPKAILEAKRAESARGYATKELMRPTVLEGVRYRREWFAKRYDEDPHTIASRLDEVAISVDAANKAGARNDRSSMLVWGRKGSRRVLLDRRTGRWEFPKLKAEFERLCAEWPEATLKLIEDKANGTALISACRDHIPGIVPIHPEGDKESRSTYSEAAFEAGNVWLPNAPWLDEYIENMVAFGAGGMHDDDVDATSQVMKRWALGVRPWLTTTQREALGQIRPGVVAGPATRWSRPEPGGVVYLGLVPGWANGQSEAVAAFVDGHGRLVALVEGAGGGVDAFVSAVVSEADYWGRLDGGRYAEMDGRPVKETVSALLRAQVRIGGAAIGKMVGDRGAGFRGTKPETAALWGTFLALLAEERAVVTDGRTLTALETVVEEGGVPKMASGEPLGGRVLALLLALAAMKANARAPSAAPKIEHIKEPVAADMWAMGRRR